MLAAPTRDWSVFQQIFADHWEAFQHTHLRYQTPYYDGLVAKMLACSNPEKIGYIAYRCLHCGQGKHLVAMRCKSSLCLRCIKVYVDTWVRQVSKALHEGVIYRHIILTVPAMFRTTFYQNAAVVLRAFMRCGAPCLDDFYSTVRGQTLPGGYITVLHTHGRHGQYHPHLHVLATSGGYDKPGERWEHLQYLPYELLRRKWQWHLLTMLRQTLQTKAIEQWVDVCFRKYPDGLVTNVQKGQVPSQSQSVARYVAKYVVSPPISIQRIDRYDGRRGTYHDRSHRPDRRSCTSSLRIILPVQESSTMPPLHHRVRGYCHDSTLLLLSAPGLGTPVAVCYVVSGMAKPQRGSSTEARHAHHVATHTRQGAETVCRPDAQAPLCGL